MSAVFLGTVAGNVLAGHSLATHVLTGHALAAHVLSNANDVPLADIPALVLPAADPVLRSAHILVVEDNENNREIASEVLRLAGCEVSLAPSGSDALAMLTTWPERKIAWTRST